MKNSSLYFLFLIPCFFAFMNNPSLFAQVDVKHSQYEANEWFPFGRPNPNAPYAVQTDFAPMIGVCDCKSVQRNPDGTWQDTLNLTWTWKYILNGYAVQDISQKEGKNGIATSIRIYDTLSQDWKVSYYSMPGQTGDPLSWVGTRQSAPSRHGDIVLKKAQKAPNGMEGYSRLTFYSIMPQEFSWAGEWVDTTGNMVYPFWYINCRKRQYPMLVEQVIDKHATLMGGKANWQKMKDYVMYCTPDRGNRPTTTVKYSMLKPNCFRIDATTNGSPRAKSYDGSDGWTLQKGIIDDMYAGEIPEMAEEVEFYEELILSKEKGYLTTLEGIEEVDSKPVYKIKLQKSADDIKHYYLNTETFMVELISEISGDDRYGFTPIQTKFKGFQTIAGAGVVMPTGFTIFFEDRPPRIINIDKIDINTGLKVSDFSRPK